MIFKKPIKNILSGMSGSYLIETENSRYIWNLDNMSYSKYSNHNESVFFKIVLVAAWPEVGHHTCFFYQSSSNNKLKYCRTSKVKRIRKL